MAGRQYYTQRDCLVELAKRRQDKKNHSNQPDQVCLTSAHYSETMLCLGTRKSCINRKLREKRQEVANRMFSQCFVLSKRLINIQYVHREV